MEFLNRWPIADTMRRKKLNCVFGQDRILLQNRLLSYAQKTKTTNFPWLQVRQKCFWFLTRLDRATSKIT